MTQILIDTNINPYKRRQAPTQHRQAYARAKLTGRRRATNPTARTSQSDRAKLCYQM
ncbi:unknown [Tropheryma whipplei str. Twist]|uniref:Uncharacterized protein n=1 Tax=Tropheryma whipplei (strain Twist) TaxID=203267 RepID=Q83GJ4_TROWT|nr:unknown [Tropheryma whipplei str. Twist]